MADGIRCGFEPLKAAGDGWAEAAGKKRFGEMCRNTFDSAVPGKVKDMRSIERKVVS